MGKLEDKGLAIREHGTQDRRVVLCSATEQGQLEAERLWSAGRERMAQCTAWFSEEELVLVARAMELIVGAAERIRGSEEIPTTKAPPAPRKGGR